MLTMSELDALIDAYPDLKPALPRMRLSFARQARPFHLWPAMKLLSEGQPCGAFHAVLSGTLQVGAPAEPGEGPPLYSVQRGDFCPVTIGCLLGQAPFPVQAVAFTQVRGVAIDRRFFLALVQNVPAFRLSVFRAVAERVVQWAQPAPAWPNVRLTPGRLATRAAVGAAR